MLLSNRRWFLISCLALAGCGFEPVYGPNGGKALRNTVLVQAPTDKNEFEFVRAIELQLGQASNQAYSLDYKLSVDQELVVVSTAQELTRFNVVGEADFTLRDMNGAIVDQGIVQSFTSYSATGSTLSTDQSERDAQRRLMVILADKLVAQLAVNQTK